MNGGIPTTWGRVAPISVSSRSMVIQSSCYRTHRSMLVPTGSQSIVVNLLERYGFRNAGVDEPAMTTFGSFGDPLKSVLSMVHSGRLLRLTMYTPARSFGHWGGTNDLEFEAARAGIPSSLLNGRGRPSLRGTRVQRKHGIYGRRLKANHSNRLSIATKRFCIVDVDVFRT